MNQLPPPLAMAECDPSTVDRAVIAATAARTRADDVTLEQSYTELEHLYPPQAIEYYNVVNLGVHDRTSYLDLGTGTGLTALACTERMIQVGALANMVLVEERVKTRLLAGPRR